MRRAFAVLAAVAGLAAAAPAAADPAQEAADANAPALLRLLDRGCIPNAEGRLPFTAGDPRLAAAGLTWLRQPPQDWTPATGGPPGEPSYATAPLPAGIALLTSVPGRICRITAADTPSGRWTLTRFEALIKAQGGWTLQDRSEGTEGAHRRWIRPGGPAGPAADLRYAEFLDGNGPGRHTRVVLLVQTF